MKYINKFEDNKTSNNKIKPGYYVIVHDQYHSYCSGYSQTCKDVYNFISNNVGKLFRIQNIKTDNKTYDVDYDNVPENIVHAFKERYVNEKYNQLYMTYTEREITFSSKNKDDADACVQANKYNL